MEKSIYLTNKKFKNKFYKKIMIQQISRTIKDAQVNQEELLEARNMK